MRESIRIVVPTFNGASTIGSCLRAVFSQVSDYPYEVVVVDSGSEDRTLEIVSSFPVSLRLVDHAAFGHGVTRREAVIDAVHCSAFVFLVQDAVPMDSAWLDRLIQPVVSGQADGSFGMQVRPPSASLFEAWSANRALPQDDAARVRRLGDSDRWTDLPPPERYRLCFFDNTNSCIAAPVFRATPFEDSVYGEDLVWARHVIQGGGTLAFVPEAKVLHWHDRGWRYRLKRAYADHELAVRLFEWRMIPSVWWLVLFTGRDVLGALRWCLSRKQGENLRLSALAGLMSQVAGHHAGAWFGGLMAQNSVVARDLRRRFDGYMRTGV